MSDAIQLRKRDRRGEWQPAELPKMPPVFVWPPQPRNFAKWFFGYPGYLWPWNTAYAVVALLTLLKGEAPEASLHWVGSPSEDADQLDRHRITEDAAEAVACHLILRIDRKRA